MEDMIVKEGDQIEGIFCHWDNGATGIIGALKAAGMEGKFLVAVDGCRAGFEQVRSGAQSVTIMQNFEVFTQKKSSTYKGYARRKDYRTRKLHPLDIVSLENIDDFTPPEW